MASTQSRTFWTTYTDYVKTLARADPSFAWLAYFFSQTPLSSNSGGQLNVLESHNDTLKEYACPLEDLGISPKAGTTRIVVFSYEEAWGIRREVLDQVALALNLPPYFLWQHLEYPGHPGENAFPGSPGVPHYTRPSAAASEVMSLEIGWTSFFHMSAMIVSPAMNSMGSVVMVLVRNRGFKLDISHPAQILGPADVSPSDFSVSQYSEEFRRSLSSMSPSAIKAANESPHDFLCPWIVGIRRLTAQNLMEYERSFKPFAQLEHFDEEILEKLLSDVESSYEITRANRNSLDKYLKTHTTACTPAMSAILQDLESLQSTIEGYRRRAHELKNRLVGTLALKESRKSIEQSMSVKRLSQLAYLFLPLSLSTSVFGMNTVELQNTRLWVFFVAAGILVLVSLVLWLMFGWISRPDITNNLIGIGKLVIILCRFFWIAPSHGITLILFATCHSTVKTRIILFHLGIWERLWNKEKPEQMGLSLPKLLSEETSWKRFWYRKISEVESFTTTTSRWYERCFWQKEASSKHEDA